MQSSHPIEHPVQLFMPSLNSVKVNSGAGRRSERTGNVSGLASFPVQESGCSGKSRSAYQNLEQPHGMLAH